ncbi:MAG: response regulator [Desulfomonile sp.]|nr:response regulator [Desulfomonile sp.]
MQGKILVIEQQPLVAEAIRQYLTEIGPQYVVVSAESVSQGMDVIRRDVVDLVVSEHQGPGGVDGLEVLALLKNADAPVRVVLCAEPELESDRIRALSWGCTVFLIKPCPAGKLCELIFNMLQPERGYSGRIVGMKLADIIEMLCFRRESTLLTVLNENGPATLYVHEGQIIHAECQDLSGVEAVYQILEMEEGRFVSQVVLDVPGRTVFMDWQSLLMEGLRQKDEIRHALSPEDDESTGTILAAPIPRVSEAAPTEAVESESRLKVMVVDDSRFIRRIVQEIIQTDPGLVVAGYAADGREALTKLGEIHPDVVLLDWDMPVMMGSTTLMHIMIRTPCPVIVLSGFVGGVGRSPFDLLGLGAVDFLRKPQASWRKGGKADDMLRRIREACRLKYDRIRRMKVLPAIRKPAAHTGNARPARHLTIINSSVGSGGDLMRIIPALAEGLPSAFVVIHDMQIEALSAFIEYLDARSGIPVRAIESGIPLVEGICYVHPAAVPLEISVEGGTPTAVFCKNGPPAGVFDRFTASATNVFGRDVAAALLSAAQGEGLVALKSVKDAGGTTVVLDPAVNVGPAMAEAATREGLVDHVSSADGLAALLQNLLSRRDESLVSQGDSGSR